MAVIAHITDLHFGAHDERIVTALGDALSGSGADIVAVSGDLTLRARPREFARARGFLDALPVPTLVVPGNHDLPKWNLVERFLRPWGRWTAHFAAEREPVARIGGTVLVGIATPRSARPHHAWAEGAVSRQQAERAARCLTGATCGVVVAHHPLVRVHGRRAADGGGDALRLLAAAGAELVLSGHHHLAHLGSAADLGGPAGVYLCHSGTAASWRRRGEPNGFTIVEVRAERFALRPYAWDGSRFAPTEARILPRR